MVPRRRSVARTRARHVRPDGRRVLCDGDGADAGELWRSRTPSGRRPAARSSASMTRMSTASPSETSGASRRPRGSSPRVTTADGAPLALAVGGGQVAFIVGGDVYVAPTTGGAPVLVASGDAASEVAIGGGWLDWAGSDAKADCPWPGRRAAHAPGRQRPADPPVPDQVLHPRTGASRGLLYWSDWSQGGVDAHARRRLRACLAREGQHSRALGVRRRERGTSSPARASIRRWSNRLKTSPAARRTWRRYFSSRRRSRSRGMVGGLHQGQVYWLEDDSCRGQRARAALAPFGDDGLGTLVFYQLSAKPNLRGLASDPARISLHDRLRRGAVAPRRPLSARTGRADELSWGSKLGDVPMTDLVLTLIGPDQAGPRAGRHRRASSPSTAATGSRAA